LEILFVHSFACTAFGRPGERVGITSFGGILQSISWKTGKNNPASRGFALMYFNHAAKPVRTRN